MKKYLAIIVIMIVGVAIFATPTFASSSVTLALSSAHPKGDSTYDVVVKDSPGTKLTIYVNGKNSVNATVNKSDWATFHKVKLPNDAKLSFTQTVSQHGKTTKKAISYVRFVTIKGSKVSFSIVDPAVVAAQAKVAAAAKAEAAAQKAAAQAAAAQAQAAANAAAAAAASCTNGTYVNSAGNTVCSPEASSSTPAGATAQCGDGTYSFSQSRSGTCSHHSGVATWL